MPEDLDATAPLKIFYAYSHADEQFRTDLSKSVALLRRQGVIQEWHDRQITGGEVWADQISNHIEEADIIALLVSPDFMASDYCFGKEMRRALERQVQGSVDVMPIILRDTDLTGAPFSHLQCLPKDGKPIRNWDNLDSAYKDVAIGIRTAVSRIKYQRARTVQENSPDALVKEDRVLDAAIAQEIPLYQPREIAIQVRLAPSEGLSLAIYADVLGAGNRERSYSVTRSDVRTSQGFGIPWSREELRRGHLGLALRLDAPRLENTTAEKNIRIEPFRDSSVFTFLVSASAEGTYHLTAQLLCKDFSLTERILKTSARQHQGPSGSPGEITEHVIAAVPLEVRARTMSATAKGGNIGTG